MRLYLTLVLFSADVLAVKPLTDSGLFEDVERSDDSLINGNLGNDNIRPSTASFHDETDSLSMNDEDLFPPDLFLTTAFPNDVPASIPAENLDLSIYSLDPESKPSLPIVEDTTCSFINDQMPMKRQAGKTCTADSINHPALIRPLELDRPVDPEFYGVSLQGYGLEQPSEDDNASACKRDVIGLPKFLVCDSGVSSDRILHISLNKIIATGYTLKNCARRMFLIFFLGAHKLHSSIANPLAFPSKTLPKPKTNRDVTYPQLTPSMTFSVSTRGGDGVVSTFSPRVSYVLPLPPTTSRDIIIARS
jgi:hypothetical protein